MTSSRRTDKLGIRAVGVRHAILRHFLKPVDIELIVRKQDEILEVRSIGAGVMPQTMQ